MQLTLTKKEVIKVLEAVKLVRDWAAIEVKAQDVKELEQLALKIDSQLIARTR